MSDLENKYITELAQIRNIVGDNAELMLFLLREHADELGVVSISEYAELLNIPKRTVQYRVSKGIIKSIEVGGVKFPCINI